MTLREAADVLGILSDNGIRAKRLTPGVWRRAMCPKCEGGREREESLAVRVDNDEKGAIWKCHRGTCGWEGNGRIAGAGRADGATLSGRAGEVPSDAAMARMFGVERW